VNGVPVDSTRMAGYLTTVSYLTGTDYRDDFIPVSVTRESYKIILTGQNMKPVEIKAYRDSKGTVLNSSLNSTSYFSGDKGQLFLRIFQGKSWFFKATKPK